MFGGSGRYIIPQRQNVYIENVFSLIYLEYIKKKMSKKICFILEYWSFYIETWNAYVNVPIDNWWYIVFNLKGNRIGIPQTANT